MSASTGASGLTALGGANTFAGLETFPAPPDLADVTMTSDEVTALCPVTGQPDWYVVAIRYRPRARCLESKTLKLYLHTFRERGLFVEAFAAAIARDVGGALRPHTIDVTVTQKARGGVAIIAHAARTYPDDGGADA